MGYYTTPAERIAMGLVEPIALYFLFFVFFQMPLHLEDGDCRPGRALLEDADQLVPIL